MIFREYISEISLLGITAVIVVITVLFNDINIQIRIKEIGMFLQRSSRDDNSIDHMGLVMKYRLHKEMYENRISDQDTAIIEARINYILSGREEKGEILPGKYSLVSIPVIYFINLIRRIIGIPLLEELKEEELNLNLEAAYYYERNRDYKKAIALYDQILDAPVSGRPLKAGVLLHQGFCWSIIGEYEKAKMKYLTVIKDYGDMSTAVTAAVMLRYLEGFRTEIERVLATEKDSTEKGEKLYKLIAYRESYEVLKRIEGTAPPSEKKKIQFFKGRTLEEIGEAGRAVEIYQNIILEDPGSEYASSANRRIFLVGSVNHEGEKIIRLAVENNKLIRDETLVKMVSEDSRFRIKNGRVKGDLPGREDFSGGKTGDAVSAVEGAVIERMIKQVEEKLSDQKSGTVKSIPHAEVRLKIYTNDGNIFNGVLVRENSEEVVIKSSLGIITISKSRISRRINL